LKPYFDSGCVDWHLTFIWIKTDAHLIAFFQDYLDKSAPERLNQCAF